MAVLNSGWATARCLSLWMALLSGLMEAVIVEKELLSAAKDAEEWIVGIRRRLHRIPELEFDLPKTTALVRKELDALGVEYKYPVGKSGIVATIGRGTPVVGLRADMDALPIKENTNLSFSSEHEGRMHACGHDAHTAMLLGAARLLKNRESKLGGTVKLVFQPAEEVGGGAKDMLDSGALDGMSAMFGFHIWPGIESGIVATRTGIILGAVNRFDVTVTGRGGHASMPHLTIDPHIPVANMILAYQTLISRRSSPLESNVVSVTSVKGGDAFNVIPDSVSFMGTMRYAALMPSGDGMMLCRSLQVDGLDELVKNFKRITHSIAEAYGCTADISVPVSGPAVNNAQNTTAFAMDVASRMFGSETVKVAEQEMAAEDFAYFDERMPSTFILLGNDDAANRPVTRLHTPEYQIDESLLHKGAALHSALAMTFLQPLSKTEL